MTISPDPSAPLVAVVGATGIQGGSVIRHLAASPKPYRIRGFTRDMSKTAAQELTAKGVEMVAVSLTVENKDAVYKAYQGMDVAFVSVSWRRLPCGGRSVSRQLKGVDNVSRQLQTSGSI